MQDREFLSWLRERLVNVYGESENMDFVQKLEAVAKAQPLDQDTRWPTSDPDREPFRDNEGTIV